MLVQASQLGSTIVQHPPPPARQDLGAGMGGETFPASPLAGLNLSHC